MSVKSFKSEIVESIEGIGLTYGKKLAEVGIKTLDDLRRMNIDNAHRKTMISEIQLEKWQGMAILQQVRGIDHQISEVLVKGRITDLEKLIKEEPDRILQMIRDAREPRDKYNIIPDDYDRVITLADVREWQREAREIISPPLPEPAKEISAQSCVSIEIQRESETSEATMGTLTIGDLTLYTLEPPAKNQEYIEEDGIEEDGGSGGGW